MNSAPDSRWWIGPLVGVLAAMPLLAIAVLYLMMSGFAFDSCEPGGCPLSEQHIAFAGIALLVSLALGVVTWPIARWVDRGVAGFVAFLCPVAAIVSVVAMWTIPPGK